MTVALLGRREDATTEFEQAEALDRPEVVARAVVALLNAQGGEVWVGVREENGVAMEIQPIADTGRAVRRLFDSLIERIDPQPDGDEIRVERAPMAEGVELLRVVAQPRNAKRPYALLQKEQGRLFPIRVGDRVRPMARHELEAAFRRGREDGDRRELEPIERALLEEQEQVGRKPGSRLWLGIQPVATGELELARLEANEYLIDPTKSGNRHSGFNFAIAYRYGGEQPIGDQVAGRSALAIGRQGLYRLKVVRDGGVRFEIPLDDLRGQPLNPEAAGRDALYPFRLSEYPVSVLRLAAAIHRDASVWRSQPSPSALVVVRLALFGLGGWVLEAGSAPRRENPFDLLEPPPRWRSFPAKDFSLEPPLRVSVEDLVAAPDRTGFLLLREVYEAFGLSERDLPAEFDRANRRLVLPE